MSTVWASAISAIVVGILALIGNVYASKKSSQRTEALVIYRIGQLESKVDKHNQVIVRTFKLEEGQAVMCEQLRVINHRIDDLEKG